MNGQLTGYTFLGFRLSMVRIGTTDVSPQVVVPTVHNIRVCACQDSRMGEGETKTFACGATGRYLVIILEKSGRSAVLTLCEVEVFGGTGFCFTIYPYMYILIYISKTPYIS